MKKNLWIGILGVGTVIYVLLQILTINPIIGYIGSVVLAAAGFMTAISVIDNKERKKAELEAATEKKRLESKKADEYSQCIAKIKEIVEKHSYLSPYYARILGQFDNFNCKEDGLRTIIQYNNNNSEAFITSKSNAVREYLMRNLKRFVKSMVAYSVTCKNEEYSGSVKSLEDILNANQDLIDWYDKLIIEVSRMSDNFNEDDADLQSLVENLQQLRMANEADGEEDDDPFN